MGIFLSRLWDSFGELIGTDDPWNVLMLGLDGAGKTTIVYKLKLNECVRTIPTIGFNVETIDTGRGIKFTIWDVGGQEAIRKLWRHYYSTCKGLLFVVDCNDKNRFSEAAEELKGIVTSPEMPAGVPVIILANKQDMPGAATVRDVQQAIGLDSLRRNKWYVQGCTATTGDGLYEAFDQLKVMLKESKNSSNSGF